MVGVGSGETQDGLSLFKQLLRLLLESVSALRGGTSEREEGGGGRWRGSERGGVLITVGPAAAQRTVRR